MDILLWALQLPPPPPATWERVGIITLLVTTICIVGFAFLKQWVVPGTFYRAKEAECLSLRQALDEERDRSLQAAKDTQMIAEALVRAREHDQGRRSW